ncbi:MAG: hypothetical protein AAB019_08250 [Planctomycetota bacterium]
MHQFRLKIPIACFFLPVSFIIIIFFLAACSSAPPLLDLDKPLSDAELEKLLREDLLIETVEPVAPVKQIELVQSELSFPDNFVLLPNASTETTYRYIIAKILNHQYNEALGLLNKFTENVSFRQPYGIEARFLRLVVLAGLRAGYLKLADTYQTGWDLTLKNERIEIEKKIDLLAKFSRQTHIYYRYHKETLSNFLDAYDDIMELYRDVPPADLKFSYPPVQKWELFNNPYLSRIKLGGWLEADKRQETEKRIFNNTTQAYFLSLLGTTEINQANLILKNKTVVLDRAGLLFWLNQGLTYHTRIFHEAAFGDGLGLIKVIENKSTEVKLELKKLLADRPANEADKKDLTLSSDSAFNPDKLLSQYNLK